MKLHILDLSPVRHVDLGFGTALNLKEGESWHYYSDNHVMIVLFFPSPSRLIACPPSTVFQSQVHGSKSFIVYLFSGSKSFTVYLFSDSGSSEMEDATAIQYQ